jgi:hypothetical protein
MIESRFLLNRIEYKIEFRVVGCYGPNYTARWRAVQRLEKWLLGSLINLSNHFILILNVLQPAHFGNAPDLIRWRRFRAD